MFRFDKQGLCRTILDQEEDERTEAWLRAALITIKSRLEAKQPTTNEN